LARLGLSWTDCGSGASSVWRRVWLLSDRDEAEVFDLLQGVLLSTAPRLDVFLGVL